MQVESSTKPKVKFEIEENHINGKVDVVFFFNIKEVQEDDSTKYKYDTYRISIQKRENLQDEIEQNYETWLEYAKNREYDKLAEEIRTKRNELLQETDKEMCIDRLNIELPKELTATNLLISVKQFFEGISSISNGSMAKYRQELRDITKQSGFPYSVIFPIKPTKENKEEQ